MKEEKDSGKKKKNTKYHNKVVWNRKRGEQILTVVKRIGNVPKGKQVRQREKN